MSEWQPIGNLLNNSGMVIVYIPLDEVNSIVMLAVYNEYIDCWIDMSGRSIKSKYVTHFMVYEKPIPQPTIHERHEDYSSADEQPERPINTNQAMHDAGHKGSDFS